MTAEINFTQPDYQAVMLERRASLDWLESGTAEEIAAKVAQMKAHYAQAPWDFIENWGMVHEPRNIERGQPAVVPFVLWQRQVEFLQWMYGMWRTGENGIVEKTRDCGATWLTVGFGVCMWLCRDGFAMGFGSRKEELVDNRGDPKSIFERVRFMVANLPGPLLPTGFNDRVHSAHMKLVNPANGASLVGEAGSEIGRGGRCSLYVVDEAAYVEQQERVDRALSMNTNCQIDISTPNGAGNAFYQKAMKWHGAPNKFIFDWRQDPRKDAAWYAAQLAKRDPVIVAQEIDRNYNASQADSFIQADWVESCVDAHITLGFDPEGARIAGFDPADTGDAKAVVLRHGSVIHEAIQRTDGDITAAIPWAYTLADEFRAEILAYDADGMGAPVMKVAFQRMTGQRMALVMYRGSAGVMDPSGLYGAEVNEDQRRSQAQEKKLKRRGTAATALRTNKDTFLNFRAQSWTWLRDRVKATHDAVQRARAGKLVNANPEDLISISSRCKDLVALKAEMSMPKRVFTKNGKIQVEAVQDMKSRGLKSPNLASALVVAVAQGGNMVLVATPVDRVARMERTRRQTVDHYEPTVPGLGLG